LAVTEHVTEVPYGVVTIDNGIVVEVVEKPRRSDWVAAGVSVLTHRTFSFFPPATRIDVPTVVSELLARGLPTAAFENPGYWIDVGTHDALDRARTDHDGRSNP
jgi:NDP-sugar pyrophosphorylase family protein